MEFKVESSSSSCNGKRKRNKKRAVESVLSEKEKQKTFKYRMETLEKMFHELTTLCDLRGLLYVKSEFNAVKNGGGLVRILPENPNECRKIVNDYINYDPKTAGKRKRGDSECTNNDNKMRKFCNGDVKEENQEVKFIDQKLNNLSVEEIQRIERNLEPMFGMISDRIDKLMMEKNKSGAPLAEGCDEDDMVMMNEPKFDYEPSSSNYGSALENELDYDTNQWLNLPGLTDTAAEKSDKVTEENKSLAKGCNEDEDDMVPLEPKFDYRSSVLNYNSGFENGFDYGINQEDWVNLPVLSTGDGNVFEPFPDLIDSEFQALNNYAGSSFTDMMINCY